MKYINTALTIPVYRVNITESRLKEADIEKLETWEAIHNSDDVSLLIRQIDDENDYPEPPEDNVEYCSVYFLAQARLPDVNLADIDAERDAFSHVPEKEYDGSIQYVCIYLCMPVYTYTVTLK
ncbi:unnamed protein product [[Candida] boidinii]|nr:unnamed protein product [[Candida] boidinii]